MKAKQKPEPIKGCEEKKEEWKTDVGSEKRDETMECGR